MIAKEVCHFRFKLALDSVWDSIEHAMNLETPTKRLLTPDELADALNVPIWKARTLWRSGRIPVVRLGHRTVRFDLDAVLAALNQAATKPRRK